MQLTNLCDVTVSFCCAHIMLSACMLPVFNLTNGIDVKETEERIAAYRKENQDVIRKNKSKLVLFGCRHRVGARDVMLCC